MVFDIGRAHERELLVRYRVHGDMAARDELVRRNLPLARRLVARYSRRGGGSGEDLFQVASLALVKAVDRFEPERGTALSTYAVPTILGEIRRHFRDTTWAAHVPRGVQELSMAVRNVEDELWSSFGRSPTPQEVAEALGATVEEVIEARQAGQAASAVPLDAPGGPGDDEGLTVADRFGGDDQHLQLMEDRLTVHKALRALSERDKRLLQMRFSEDLTQQEIAERIGVSQMHVSRLLRRTLDSLHRATVAVEQA
jgi:RNA polymerase sigma-B factor